MCGIAGIYSSSRDLVPYRSSLKDMMWQIRHRGPDESGVLSSQKILMGSVRLNIIDLRNGTQPLSDESGRFWVVFNGEIFNYLELKQELTSRGYRFRTESDTEVLVNLYAEEGPGCLEKLNGQFAFAIWDKHQQKLFMARDRVGIRPLYYTRQNGMWVFASEIKALLAVPGIQARVNPQALRQLFAFWTPLSPNTMFEGIYEVPPAHYMILQGDNVVLEKYWDLRYSEQGPRSAERAADEFRELFHDAVKIRLRSDVPVAAYLSGGIDSTATTSFIKEIQPRNLETFSIGFDEADYDETHYQEEASRYLDTRHNRVMCSNKDIVRNLARVVWHTESPLLRTAPVPMYLLSRLVHRHGIKVVITGEGADEMLAGYNIFKETAIRHFWSKQPHSQLRPLLLKKLYPYIPYIQNANPGILKMFFGQNLQDTDSPFYSHQIRWNNTARIKHYLSTSMVHSYDRNDPREDLAKSLPESFDRWTPLAKAQWLESHLFMSGYLLSAQGDRMAMANSVEGRYPFLDHRIMEYAASLPSRLKLNGLNEKYLLKKVMAKRIPENIIKRSKQAYRAPIASLFNGSDTPESIRSILSPDRIQQSNMFDSQAVEGLKKKYTEGKNISETDDMALIGIISSQLFYEQFIQPKGRVEGRWSQLNIRRKLSI